MNKKEPPKQIDSTEQNSDTNLNMNELLERQKEQRNLDLRVFPQTEKQKPKIKIEKEMGLIKNDITDLSYLNEGKNMELEEINSYKTPRGLHIIRAKIGKDTPINTIFVGRRPTGEIYTSKLAEAHPKRDWILTRILWLSGLEIGKNRFGNVDTMRRYIYIHGTPEVEPMEVPLSHGCIRMHNNELIQLFDMVDIGTKVLIK